MTPGGSPTGLLGRENERNVLDGLIEGARDGRGAALVLHGEPGIGKTALHQYAARRATGFQVVRTGGAESEAELAFGALHQLCTPFLDRLGSLPVPQRDALATAFGLSQGAAPDRFLVGLAVLGLLADGAAARPVLCLVDDAQWLDRVSAQAIAFVARRLVAERVAILVAMRELLADHPLGALPGHPVPGLSDDEARALLVATDLGRLEDRVQRRILAEARGNPLAILELPRDLPVVPALATSARGAGRSVTNQMEQGFERRVRALPRETRLLLLTAAAEPLGDVALLRRATDHQGIDLSVAAAPAVAANLLSVGGAVLFRHPLVRSAVYRAAPARELRDVHRALAHATDPESDPDRHVWHVARATAAPDEAVAAALERAAGRARARGGTSAAAAFLDRAAELTPDPGRRGLRTLAAARAAYQAGAHAQALALVDAALLHPLDARGRAEADLVRGRVLFASRSASAGLPLLVGAARRLEPLDPRLARETYRDTIYAALTAGTAPGETGVEHVAAAIRAMAPVEPPDRTNMLLDGLARVITEGPAAGFPLLQQGLTAFNEHPPTSADIDWLPLACRMAHDAWDFRSWSVLSARLVALARETGALSLLPSALLLRLSNRAQAGDLTDAVSIATEATMTGEAVGGSFFAHYATLVLEAWRGDEVATRRVIEVITHDLSLRGEGKVLTATEWASAVLYNGMGRYAAARDAAERGCAHPQEMGLSTWSMVELVEASVRVGRRADAAEAVARIDEMARAARTDWALGTASTVTALVSDGTAAEDGYREAIHRLERTEVRLQTARAHLLFGEWLRREGRRREARKELTVAHERLTRFGATAFAERARRELAATGAAPERPARRAGAALTPQEAQVARLAAEGLTNPEIGSQLFLSPHTVEWHLRKVFTKLGIASRREIRASLAASAPV